jgi:hypothetical protein
MEIRTIEHDFEYQMKEVFSQMKEAFEYDVLTDGYTGTFSGWLWNNTEEFGKYTFERVDSWCGVDELFENLEND